MLLIEPIYCLSMHTFCAEVQRRKTSSESTTTDIIKQHSIIDKTWIDHKAGHIGTFKNNCVFRKMHHVVIDCLCIV